MNTQHTRRDFLKIASLLPLCGAAATVNFPSFAQSAFAQDTVEKAAETTLKTSLNAYSFNKMLNDNLKHRGPGVTLLKVLEFAAKNKFEGFDATGYYFPELSRSAERFLHQRIEKAGGRLSEWASAASGVRDNLTTSDKAVRAAAVQHIKEWVEVAAEPRCAGARVFADTQMRAKTWHGCRQRLHARSGRGLDREDAQRMCRTWQEIRRLHRRSESRGFSPDRRSAPGTDQDHRFPLLQADRGHRLFQDQGPVRRTWPKSPRMR